MFGLLIFGFFLMGFGIQIPDSFWVISFLWFDIILIITIILLVKIKRIPKGIFGGFPPILMFIFTDFMFPQFELRVEIWLFIIIISLFDIITYILNK